MVDREREREDRWIEAGSNRQCTYVFGDGAKGGQG